MQSIALEFDIQTVFPETCKKNYGEGPSSCRSSISPIQYEGMLFEQNYPTFNIKTESSDSIRKHGRKSLPILCKGIARTKISLREERTSKYQFYLTCVHDEILQMNK